MIVSDVLFGTVDLGVGSGLTVSGLARAGIMCASSISFISTLIKNELFSKLKVRYTKTRDSINVITLLYENTFNTSIIDKKMDHKEALEMKEKYNHYLDRRSEIMRNRKFKVEDIFGDIINIDNISQDQINKLIIFQPK